MHQREVPSQQDARQVQTTIAPVCHTRRATPRGLRYHGRRRRLRTLVCSLVAALASSSGAFCEEIHDAASRDQIQKVKALLRADPELVHARDRRGWTPLHYAAGWGRKEVAELLLANKADMNAQTERGWTPLDMAISLQEDSAISAEGKVLVSEIVALLRRYGSKESQSGELHRATFRADVGRLEALLKENPELVDKKDERGYTPLGTASFLGHRRVAELLISRGSDINAKIDSCETPLHLATLAGRKEVVELLLANKADVDAKVNSGWTPLWFAAFHGRKEIATLLLGSGADVNARDNIKWTPLHRAAEMGNKEMVELLLANGADANAMDGGVTALRLGLSAKEGCEREQGKEAASRRYDESIAVLRAHGAKALGAVIEE